MDHFLHFSTKKRFKKCPKTVPRLPQDGPRLRSRFWVDFWHHFGTIFLSFLGSILGAILHATLYGSSRGCVAKGMHAEPCSKPPGTEFGASRTPSVAPEPSGFLMKLKMAAFPLGAVLEPFLVKFWAHLGPSQHRPQIVRRRPRA